MTEFERWLIGTVPGIIILGTIGSIAAYWLIQFAARILDKVSSTRRDRSLQYAFSRGYLARHFQDHPTGLNVLLAFQLSRLVVCMTLLVASFLLFYLLFSLSNGNPFHFAFHAGFFFLLISMVLGFLVFRQYSEIDIWYRTYVTHVEKSAFEAYNKRKDEKKLKGQNVEEKKSIKATPQDDVKAKA